MVLSHVSRPARRLVPGLLALVIALSLLVTTSLTAFANTVRISDPVQVLNVSQVTSAGVKLPYNLDIYTTSTYTGSAADFTARTISAHLSSPALIVIAIDTTHRYLAIVGGKNVPLTKDQYSAAGTAFGKNIAGNHYTDATIAAIQSLKSALATRPSSTGGSSQSGGFLLWIIVIVVALIVIGALFRFIRRLLGFAPPPRRPTPPQAPTNYGDGRDNLGGGAAGTF
ncbi:MAG TPA: hypothetical protein VF458_17060 [Ktedonobacteraceae bacterium]